MFDIKLNSFGQRLNPNLSCSSNNNHADFTYDKDDIDIKNSYSNNKPKKNVTFDSFSEDKITLETSDENEAAYKNINTFLVETNKNINNNSAQLKNIQNVEETTIQCTKNNIMESKEMHFNNIDKPMNDGDLNAHTNKRKTIDVQSDFKFKKPYTPVQDKNKINSTIIQPSKMKTNQVFFNLKN